MRPPTVERRGVTIHVDGEPTLLLEAPIQTRPQDWTPAQVAILWGAEVAAQMLQASR